MADIQAVAKSFTDFYYQTFDKDRSALRPLYKDMSMMTFENAQFAGADNIINKLTSLPFQRVAHKITTVDAQPFQGGVIIVMVTGALLVDEESNPTQFCQCFQLVPEGPGNYFVFNGGRMMGESNLPTYTPSQVSAKKSAADLWITHSSKVYNISTFINDHPGGPEIILQYAGKDISQLMDEEHQHSTAAIDILQEYLVGTLDGKAVQIREKVERFVDIEKPMLEQVWFGGFTKEFYLEQVHLPRHTTTSPPIFSQPYLEPFTKTSWYVIPTIWLPVAFYFLSKSSFFASSSFPILVSLFAIGVWMWTLIEYTLHRFLFHVEDFLPDNRVGITAHFLMHGIHHYLPMDRKRLVMPPVLLAFLSSFVAKFYFLIFPYDFACVFLSGSYVGYVGYDLMHYYLHHGKPFGAHIREMKTYHMDHHYKEPNEGFGITTKFWDHVFGTVLVLKKAE